MPQKSTSILFTLLSSVFMMVTVSVMFHFPTKEIHGAMTSSFLTSEKRKDFEKIPYKTSSEYGNIDQATIRYIPR